MRILCLSCFHTTDATHIRPEPHDNFTSVNPEADVLGVRSLGAMQYIVEREQSIALAKGSFTIGYMRAVFDCCIPLLPGSVHICREKCRVVTKRQ